LFRVNKLERVALAIGLLVGLSHVVGGCGSAPALHPQGEGGGPGGNGGDGGQPGVGGSPGVGGQGTGGEDPFGGTGGRVGTGGVGVGGMGVGGLPFGIGGQGVGGSPAACAQAGTQAACDASPNCYSVFFDPNTCGCSGAGCCAHFNHCAEGPGGAQCYGGVSCALSPPFCEGPYVVSYRGDCFEGCVNSADCAPVCTPGADQTCNDNPIVSSLHGHCTAAGICQCNPGVILNPNTGRCL
jgi:hypothetical protein